MRRWYTSSTASCGEACISTSSEGEKSCSICLSNADRLTEILHEEPPPIPIPIPLILEALAVGVAALVAAVMAEVILMSMMT